jgi:hypothetical protein
VHRIAPSRRLGRRRPLGELPRRPSRPRVRSPSRASWGRQRHRAVDRNLIERSSASRTPSVFRLADGRASSVSPFEFRLPRAPCLEWAGPVRIRPGPPYPGPCLFFSSKTLLLIRFFC